MKVSVYWSADTSTEILVIAWTDILFLTLKAICHTNCWFLRWLAYNTSHEKGKNGNKTLQKIPWHRNQLLLWQCSLLDDLCLANKWMKIKNLKIIQLFNLNQWTSKLGCIRDLYMKRVSVFWRLFTQKLISRAHSSLDNLIY